MTRSTPRPTTSRASRPSARVPVRSTSPARGRCSRPSRPRRTSAHGPGLHPDLGLPGDARPGPRRLQPLRRGKRRPGLRRDQDLHRQGDPHQRRTGRVAHTLRLVGNDGTFSLPTTSRPMPKGATVDIPVKARTSTPGAHSAILEIDDPATKVVDQRVLLTVVLSQDLAAPSFAETSPTRSSATSPRSSTSRSRRAPRPCRSTSAGVAPSSQVRWIAFNPYGVPVESTSSLVCFTNFSDPSCNSTSRTYANPLPGIWELEIEARRTTPTLANPFTIAAAVQGVVGRPGVPDPRLGDGGPAGPGQWTVTNQFGQVTRHAAGRGRSAARSRLARRSPTTRCRSSRSSCLRAPRASRRRSGGRPTRAPTSTCSSCAAARRRPAGRR